MVIKTIGNSAHSYYEQFMYPDGAMQVRIKPKKIEEIKAAKKITVISRISSSSHEKELILLRSAIGGITAVVPHLILPCLPYARADRRFMDGDCFGLLAFLNGIKAGGSWLTIKSLDIHSQDACYGTVKNVSPEGIIGWAISDFVSRMEAPKPPFINLAFADSSARSRYPGFISGMTVVGCNNNAVEVRSYDAKKARGADGRITHYEIGIKDKAPLMVIDDLCDGGATFNILAKSLEYRPGYSGLYTTHGIYSAGFGKLLGNYDHIYCTDSFDGQEGSSLWLHRFPVDAYLASA